jgi:hypothetical protein
MRRIVLSGFVLGCLMVGLVGAAPAAASNSDAAHACQHGGYLTLQGTDGTRFRNTGECVSFAARGGTIVGISAVCEFIAGVNGCVVFDDLVLSSTVHTGVVTLSGAFTFTPVCIGTCGGYSASGGGTFTASGPTGSSSGTWTVDVYTPGPFDFRDPSNNPTTCDAASLQIVTVAVHFFVGTTEVSGGWIETRLQEGGTPTQNVVIASFSQLAGGFLFTDPDAVGATLLC